MLAKLIHRDIQQALTSLASGDSMCNAEDLGKISANARCASVSKRTYAASTYDRIVPTCFPHNDNSCKEPRSYSEDTEYSTRRHGRDDHLIGGMA